MVEQESRLAFGLYMFACEYLTHHVHINHQKIKKKMYPATNIAMNLSLGVILLSGRGEEEMDKAEDLGLSLYPRFVTVTCRYRSDAC